MNPLKPRREIAVPHEDVLKGTFQQAEFAADLSRVHGGTATPEQVRSTPAWQSIVSDIKEMRLNLNLDQYQSRQANASYEDTNDALRFTNAEFESQGD